MDIDEVRRANIHLLEKEAGSATAAAERVGMTYVQYVNLRDGAKDSETGKPRGMYKSTARRFEVAFEKPHGWLDQDHSAQRLPAPDQAFLYRVEQEVARYAVPEHIQAAILTLIEASPLRTQGAAAHAPPPKEAKAA